MLPRSSQRYDTYRENDSLLRRFRRLIGFLVLVFIVYACVTTILVSTVIEDSEAMSPTLAAGDRLFVLPLVYGPRIRLFGWVLPGIRSPARGDLVAVRPGYARDARFLTRLVDPFYRFITLQHHRADDGTSWDSSLQIKRIVGLPGDTVRIERFIAYVTPAGGSESTSEFAQSGRSYTLTTNDRPGAWDPSDPFGAANESVTLGNDEYFVLSDDRNSGIDSRHWGPVTRSSIVGYVSVRFWPLSRFGRP